MLASARFIKVYVFTQVKNRLSAIENNKQYRNSIFNTRPRKMADREVYFTRVLHLSRHGEDVLLHTVKVQHIFKKILQFEDNL